MRRVSHLTAAVLVLALSFAPFTVGEPEMLGVDELGDVVFFVKSFIPSR